MPKPSAAMLAEGHYTFKSHASEGKCWVKGCRRDSRRDGCLCQVHMMRRWRSKNPQVSAYCTLRDHANERKIPFTITIDYWRGMTDAYGFYDAVKDPEVVLSIDRVNPSLGYIEGNLRIVTSSVNSSKSNRERYLPEHIQSMLQRKRNTMRDKLAPYLQLDSSASAAEEVDEQATQQDYLEEDCPF